MIALTNDSANMKGSNGYIQGYSGVAMVDDKHQIIVGAEAFGEATEYNISNTDKVVVDN